jgi:Xaa-Pro aminopeptidase
VITTEIVPDEPGLRLARRDRVRREMDAAGIDALVIGREANARYVSGVPRLWLAGTRPFGPGCVLVRESGAVHLLSTWDEGVPEEIPHDHLYGYTFNPANVLEALRGIAGAAGFRQVATDGMSPSAAALLPQAFPAATLVDGEQLLRRARRTKSPEEVDAIRAAVAVAERGIAAAVDVLEPGRTERELTGVFMAAMGAEGVCMPAIQDVAWITSTAHPWRRTSRDRAVRPGDLVVLEGSVMLDGYAGGLARTHVVGVEHEPSARLRRRRDELWARLLERCRPGAPLAGLLHAYEVADLPLPPMPVAHGLGLGYDDPVVAAGLPATAAAGRFEAGMVLALSAYAWEAGIGSSWVQDPIVITLDGAESLSTMPFAPG